MGQSIFTPLFLTFFHPFPFLLYIPHTHFSFLVGDPGPVQVWEQGVYRIIFAGWLPDFRVILLFFSL